MPTTTPDLQPNATVRLLYDLPFKSLTLRKGTTGRVLRCTHPSVYMVAFDMPAQYGEPWVYRAEVAAHEVQVV
jgi:hypothetical protein